MVAALEDQALSVARILESQAESVRQVEDRQVLVEAVVRGLEDSLVVASCRVLHGLEMAVLGSCSYYSHSRRWL